MKIKTLVLDMDGTLLNGENVVDPNLIILLEKLRSEHNIKFFIATGRSMDEIKDVLPVNFCADGYITANGMINYNKENMINYHILDSDLIETVITKARESKIYYELHPLEGSRFALEEDFQVFTAELHKKKSATLTENEYKARIDAMKKDINWVEKLNFEDLIKVYFFSMNAEVIKNWKMYLEELKEEINFTTSSSSQHNVEIMVDEVSKATGVQRLLQEYDLSHENLMAIGDAENDLSMLKLAAYSVAMENASEVVKQEADDITNYSHKEQGLYLYLSEKFKI
ncbi:Cof-type HAD-IIB family hydrolase [Salimicrobium album]|uniref:Cof subfamily of IIB subfamily of haloacid dehalogenase superfamily/HAD-superfamily hydrolase, subfamily IIB n=1 Tax=Salimicrobium album TaxID=50717 RepID=A0A1H3H6G6_9BACI|nr:Cof-type HAD-IIB family hydrolase [Salimicrobium album]SDY11153.1 hypothetical protein SAMN04488081_2083 [Salimicrobium album]